MFEEDSKRGCKIQSFMLPTNSKFPEEEKRNLYLSEYIKHENVNVKDKAAKMVLVNYLEKYYSKQNQNSQVESTVKNMMIVIYDHENKAAPRSNEEEPLQSAIS